MLFGIFNIKEAESKESNIDNSYYDKFYEEFGDIFPKVNDSSLSNDYKRDLCVERYKSSQINKSEDIQEVQKISKSTIILPEWLSEQIKEELKGHKDIHAKEIEDFLKKELKKYQNLISQGQHILFYIRYYKYFLLFAHNPYMIKCY